MSKHILLLAGAAFLFAGVAQADATEAQVEERFIRTTAAKVAEQESHPAVPADAAEDSAQANLEKWQLRRLNEPTERELAHEREGNVHIYDGLTDRDVDQALSTHFERIQHMMFLGTRKTIPTDSENSDAEGNVETESPGCL